MTPTLPPRTVVVEIDGERREYNGRPAAIIRGIDMAMAYIEAAAGESLRITIHCGLKDEDVTVEVPSRVRVNRC